MKLNRLTLLGGVLIGLKLSGFISWSWWLVLLPFWLVPGLFFGFTIAAGLVTLGVVAMIVVYDYVRTRIGRGRRVSILKDVS